MCAVGFGRTRRGSVALGGVQLCSVGSVARWFGCAVGSVALGGARLCTVAFLSRGRRGSVVRWGVSVAFAARWVVHRRVAKSFAGCRMIE